MKRNRRALRDGLPGCLGKPHRQAAAATANAQYASARHDRSAARVARHNPALRSCARPKGQGFGGDLRDVFIVGASQTPVNKDPEVRDRYLGAAALTAALADAHVEPASIGALYAGNMMSGTLARQQQLGALLADYAGLAGVAAVTLEGACA